MAAKKAKRKTAKKAATKKTVRKTAARKTTRKPAKRKTVKKATRKVAKKVTRKPAKKTARKTVKKTAARKATKKVVKKAAPVSEIKIKKIASVRKAYSKTQIVSTISEQVGVSRKQAAAMMEVFHNIVHAHMTGCGEFKSPGMFKVVVTKKPARKARKGINPFTGEEMMFKAKPAHKVVKIRPLKNLKEMVK